MKIGAMIISILIGFPAAGPLLAAAPVISEATSECIDCHASIHPGIVKDWQTSRHAELQRR